MPYDPDVAPRLLVQQSSSSSIDEVLDGCLDVQNVTRMLDGQICLSLLSAQSVVGNSESVVLGEEGRKGIQRFVS